MVERTKRLRGYHRERARPQEMECNERQWPVGGSASKQPVECLKELLINPSSLGI